MDSKHIATIGYGAAGGAVMYPVARAIGSAEPVAWGVFAGLAYGVITQNRISKITTESTDANGNKVTITQGEKKVSTGAGILGGMAVWKLGLPALLIGGAWIASIAKR